LDNFGPSASLLLASSGSSATSASLSFSPVYFSVNITSYGAPFSSGIVLLTAPVAFLASKEFWIPSSLANLAKSALDNFGPSAAILLSSSGSTAASATYSFSPVCFNTKITSLGALLSAGIVLFTAPVAFLASRDC